MELESATGRRIVDVIARGTRLQLLPERAVYIPDRRLLLVADLHWGKAEAFQASGIRVPSTVLANDLDRLARAVNHCGAERVIVLGDLVHAPRHLGPKIVEEISDWRRRNNFPLELVPGNHDRFLRMPLEWRIHVHGPSLDEIPFTFTHDAPMPKKSSDAFVITGHIHPRLKLKRGNDSLRLACFVMSANALLLPAFSEFTAGVDQSQLGSKKFFVIAENQVIEI